MIKPWSDSVLGDSGFTQYLVALAQAGHPVLLVHSEHSPPEFVDNAFWMVSSSLARPLTHPVAQAKMEWKRLILGDERDRFIPPPREVPVGSLCIQCVALIERLAQVCIHFSRNICELGSVCKFRHVCTNCGKPDHGRVTCPEVRSIRCVATDCRWSSMSAKFARTSCAAGASMAGTANSRTFAPAARRKPRRGAQIVQWKERFGS